MTSNSNESNQSILKSILFMVLPVALGVFLGLVANNWNEGRKSRLLETIVLQKIEQDIIANKSQLESVLEYHKSLRDSVEVYHKKMSKETLMKSIFEMDEGDFFWKGTRTGTMRDAGYQTAIVSGVLANLDFDLVALFSEVNQIQENYEKLNIIYTQSIINKDSQTKVIDYLSFAQMFSYDISIVEEQLIELYDITLKELEK